MFKISGQRIMIVLLAFLALVEIAGLWIDYYRERQLEARAEIIVLAVTARLENSRPLSCEEIEKIRALWDASGFNKAKRWEEIQINGCQ